MANVDTIDITKLILVEQGSTPSSPSAGKQKLFVRSSDHLLCLVDSAGTVTPYGGALTNPMTTSQDIIVGGSSGTPGRLAKGGAGSVLGMSNGSLAYLAGSSFPGSPATNDIYFRTDKGLWYYYDGTRWLSVQIFSTPLVHEDSGNTWPLTATILPVHRAGAVITGASDLYLLTWESLSSVVTTNTGSAFWTANLRKFNAAGGGDTVIATYDTSADTAGNDYQKSVAINALLGSYVGFYTDVVKTSTPGSFRFHGGVLRYRQVAT